VSSIAPASQGRAFAMFLLMSLSYFVNGGWSVGQSVGQSVSQSY